MYQSALHDYSEIPEATNMTKIKVYSTHSLERFKVPDHGAGEMAQ